MMRLDFNSEYDREYLDLLEHCDICHNKLYILYHSLLSMSNLGGILFSCIECNYELMIFDGRISFINYMISQFTRIMLRSQRLVKSKQKQVYKSYLYSVDKDGNEYSRIYKERFRFPCRIDSFIKSIEHKTISLKVMS